MLLVIPCLCCHLFHDSVWSSSFWVEANPCRFFIVCLHLYCRRRSKYQEEGCQDPIIQFNPHFCARSNPGPGFPSANFVFFMCCHLNLMVLIFHFVYIYGSSCVHSRMYPSRLTRKVLGKVHHFSIIHNIS